jgi:WXG100 family type VII secretion target
MAKISVTPEELRSQSQVYTQGADSVDQVLSSINSMNSQIETEWQGAAFQAYMNQYQNLSKQVQQFSQLLRDINQQLNNVANNKEEGDQTDAQMFDN